MRSTIKFRKFACLGKAAACNPRCSSTEVYVSRRIRRLSSASNNMNNTVLMPREAQPKFRRWLTSSSSARPSSVSVSDEELRKFSKMSEQWWDHRTNPLISMNPVRVSYMIEMLDNCQGERREDEPRAERSNPLGGMKILDVGCGGGLLSESLARLGGNVVGVDPSEVIAAEAERHATEMLDAATLQRLTYRGGLSIEGLAEEMHGASNEDLFDVICILEVLEHTTNPTSILRAASSILKKPSSRESATERSKEKGGTLFVSTINRTIQSFGVAILGAEYVTQSVPLGTHDWRQFYSPNEIQQLMIQDHVRLHQKDVCGMVISNPLCVGLAKMPIEWHLDRSNLNVNWIGAYKHREGMTLP